MNHHLTRPPALCTEGYNWRNATHHTQFSQKLDVRGVTPRIMSRSGAWAIKGVSASLAVNFYVHDDVDGSVSSGRDDGNGGGGRVRALSVVAYAGSHVQVYELSASAPMPTYAIPEDKVRAMALVLGAEPSRGRGAVECVSPFGDAWRAEERLGPGVFRGWGNKQLRLVTGGEKIKVWRLPTRYDIHVQDPFISCSSVAEG